LNTRRCGRGASLALLVASALTLPGAGEASLAGAAEEAPLRVRVSAEPAPCVAAASRSWSSGRKVVFETAALRDPGPVDVIVGTGPEMTRALEGGRAVVNSDVEVAEIPWVLSVAAGNPLRVRDLADLGTREMEVLVLGGPAAYEARRALGAGRGSLRVREETDRETLRAAPVALVPLSLAGAGDRIKVDLPPLRASAAVAVGAARPEQAAALVRYLGSEGGQRAFASCGQAAR
jgi:hypothetical protein